MLNNKSLLLALCLLISTASQALLKNFSAVDETLPVIESELKVITAPFGGFVKTQVHSGPMASRLREYASKFWRDEAQARKAKIVEGALALTVDTPELGVFASSDVAWAEVQRSLSDQLENLSGNSLLEAQSHLQTIHKTFQSLAHRKVEFGYDAWQENNCAAPTPYLLVMDTQRGVIYGVNLLPCEE